MLFAPRELPRAIVVPREATSRFAADTKRWAINRWSWIRPRTLPMLVAVTGFFAIVASGRYLSNMVAKPPRAVAMEEHAESACSRPMKKMRLVDWGNTSTLVDLSDIPSQ